jgi:flagellar assembly protein FliH
MSLSRFYKHNQDFQPETLLPHENGLEKKAIWGESIIKEEVTEVNAPEISTSEETVTENIPEDPIQEITKEIPTSPPAPIEPAIDLETIRNEAFASGVDIGRKEAEEDFENTANTFLCICNELDKLRETILRNSITEMKELVMDISEKIIRHSITEQDETIIATLKDAIQLAVKSDEIQIQVNPDDIQCIEGKKQDIINSISGLENIILQADSTIDRGGCKLESSCCTVDATLTSQIKVIRDNVIAADFVQEQNTD